MLGLDLETIKTVAGLGGTGIAVLLVILNHYERKDFSKTIQNHLHDASLMQKDTNESNKKLAASLQRLADTIAQWHHAVK